MRILSNFPFRGLHKDCISREYVQHFLRDLGVSSINELFIVVAGKWDFMWTQKWGSYLCRFSREKIAF
jgi:hypothetical protein